MAARSACRCANCASLVPTCISSMCISPPIEHDAPRDGAPFHQGMAFARLREPKDAADERLDGSGREQMQRDVYVLVGCIAGTADADAPRDHEPRVDFDSLCTDISQYDHGRVLCGRP